MKCPDCKKVLKLEVLRSNAGYYIGTQCNCGPYSRNSDYFRSPKDAEEELQELKEFGPSFINSKFGK